MTTFNVDSALEPKIQFERGFAIDDREGRYKAPATAYDEGTIVKVSSDGETFEISGTSDGQFYLEQPCDTVGPIGNATNREKYLQGIPMKSVKCSTQISAYPHKPGAIIWTKNYASGTETGALTALTVTVGDTVLEHYNGVWRIRQSSNKVMGKVIGFDATNAWVRIFLMDGIT